MKGLINSKYDGIDCQFNEHGWFNATLAASKFDKRPIDWLRLDETQNYINALCEQLEISEPKSLIKAKRNNGTWLHPKLAVPFTRWLDTSFGVWCDLQIDQLLRGDHPVIDIRRLRHRTAATYKAVCSVLQVSRQQQGKETKPHHYMNEARLINWAMTGQFTGLDRDSLTFDEMDLLATLEAQDLILIASQCSYDHRKTALNIFAQNFKAKSNILNHQSTVLGA